MNTADFNGALTILDGIDIASAPASDRLRAHLLRAACLFALRRKVEAEASYAAALRIDPALVLDESAAPDVLAAFGRVKSRMVGTVRVRANSNGAVVFVDGKSVGPVPQVVQVIAGKHQITINSDAALNQEIDVEAGAVTQVVFNVSQRAPQAVVPSPAQPRSGSSKVVPISLIGVGAAGAVAGAVLMGTAAAWNPRPAELTINQAVQKHAAAVTQHSIGIGALAVGAAAAVTGVVLLLRSADQQQAMFIIPSAGGGIVGIGGAF